MTTESRHKLGVVLPSFMSVSPITQLLWNAQPPFLRVHISAVQLYSKMQMWSCGITCAPHISYILSSDHLLTFFNFDLAQMTIYRLKVIAVVDNNTIAETTHISRRYHNSVFTCQHFDTFRECYIKALMVCRTETSGQASWSEVR